MANNNSNNNNKNKNNTLNDQESLNDQKPTSSNKPNTNGNKPGKPGNGKPNGSGKPCDKPKNKRNYPNDPLYYAPNEQELRNMASFNWSDKVGSNPYRGAGSIKQYRVPGVLKFNYKPTLGCFKANDLVNNEITRAADAFFNSMSQGYTGSVPFEAADLIMFVLGAAQVFVKIEEGKRAYGCMKYASLFNGFMPKQLVNACGFDYDSLNNSLADFRTSLNKIIDQCNKWFAVPHAFAIMKRWLYLATNVMIDTPNSEKAQFYVYKSNSFMKVDTTSFNTGTALTYTTGAKVETVEQYFNSLNSLISALRSQDTNNIFGSLRRVYKESDFYAASALTDEYSTPVLHEQVILEQVHNITLVTNVQFIAPREIFISSITGSSTYVSAEVALYQQDGFICSNPVTDTAAMDITLGEDAIIDVLVDGYPGAQALVEATANVVGRKSTDLSVIYDQITSGTAVAKQGKYIYPRAEVVMTADIYNSEDGYLSYDLETIAAPISSATLEKIAAMSSFNYGLIGKSSYSDRLVILGELTNFGHVSYDNIAQLNLTTFYTLLALPIYTKSVTK